MTNYSLEFDIQLQHKYSSDPLELSVVQADRCFNKDFVVYGNASAEEYIAA